ncbi:MAG: hypothetical protein JRN39_05725 [Nitrososphaerota archaeon]|nr:hypothetical protein [Nitrososphaerota archaeon]
MVRVANLVGSLATKGVALSRLKDKDSYDIYALAGFYGGSPERASDEFKRIISSSGQSKNAVMEEAVGNIRNGFSFPTRYGCFAVARFMGSDGEIRNDAYQRVSSFVKNVVR